MDEVPKILASFHAYDREDVDLYSHASGYFSAFWDLGNFLREIEKWNLDKYATPYDLLTAIRERYGELQIENHLPMD